MTVIGSPPEGGTAGQVAVLPSSVRYRPCPLCGTPAAVPCQPKPAADHLARWLDAYTAGKLTKAYMARVLGGLVVIDACAVVTGDGPECALCGHGELVHYLGHRADMITRHCTGDGCACPAFAASPAPRGGDR
jgi:hypothetical protein